MLEENWGHFLLNPGPALQIPKTATMYRILIKKNCIIFCNADLCVEFHPLEPSVQPITGLRRNLHPEMVLFLGKHFFFAQGKH